MKQTAWIPQENHEEFNKVFAQMSDSAVQSEIPNLTTYLTPPSFYRRNYISPFGHPDLKAIGESIIENAKKGFPTLTSMTPALFPEGAEDILFQMGFEVMLPQFGMIFESGTPFDKTVDENIEVIQKDALSAWIDTMIEGFAEEQKEREDVVFESLIKSPDMSFFGYHKDGQIAGTGILYRGKDYAGIYEIAVPKRYRGHGIATAIVRHILRIAEDAGLKGTVLVASPMGQPVYERIGFEPLCRMDNLIYTGTEVM